MKTLAAATKKSPLGRKLSGKTQPKSPRRKLYLAIAAQLLALSAPAWAGPEGGVVIDGEGDIEQSGTTTTITQNTDRLSIDWDSFNVDLDERVEFIQPSQDSLALNRIMGGNASSILGQIDANGHVVLMNPNGILFGRDASINVGGLIATGLSIDPSDFMNGDFALDSIDGSGGAVINKGVINAATGGNVALIGTSVENSGLISAKLGTVTLAAGTETIVSFDSKGFLGVKVTKEVLQEDIGVTAVQNSGDIEVEGGRILLTASVSQDIFTKAVNAGELNVNTSVVMHDDGTFTLGGGADVVNTGSIDVSSDSSVAGRIVVLGENIDNTGSILADNTDTKTSLANAIASSFMPSTAGSIELHAADTTMLTESSHISASASRYGKGGDVKILGDKIALLDDASISATGAKGGGSILVGGDQEGKNDLVRNASFIAIDKDTSIDASATQKGDGGTVITFAEDTARIHGDLAARGGDVSGDGGFIETSGLQGFEITSVPDTSAGNGEFGSWLIDPIDLTIGAPLPDDGIELSENIFTSVDLGGSTSNMSAQLIESAFDTNDNVIIRTGAGGTGTGFILVTGGDSSSINIDAGTGKSLTLEAHEDIIIARPFILQGANLILNADNSVVIDDNIDTNGGSLFIVAGGDIDVNASNISTQGGDIATAGGDFNATAIGGAILLNSSNVTTNGGNIDLTATSGIIDLRSTVGSTTFITNGGNIDLNGTFAIIAGESTFNTVGGGSGHITMDSSAITTPRIMDAQGNVTLSAGIVDAGDISLRGGDLTIIAPDVVFEPGASVITGGGNIDMTVEAVLEAGFASFNTLGQEGPGNVRLSVFQMHSGAMDIQGDLDLNADSSLTTHEMISVDGRLTIKANGLSTLSDITASSMIIEDGRSTTIGAGTTLTTTNGELSLSASDNLIIDGDINALESITLTADTELELNGNITSTRSNINATVFDLDIILGNGSLTARNGAITLETFNGGVVQSADTDFSDISIEALDIDIQASGGGIDLDVLTLNATNSLNLESRFALNIPTDITAGSMTIETGEGELTVGNGVTLSTTAGDLSLSSNTDLNINGNIDVTGGDFTATGFDSLTIASNVNVSGSATLTATEGTLSIADGASVTSGVGDLTLRSNNATISGSLRASDGDIRVTQATPGLNVINIDGGDLTTLNGSVSLGANSDILIGGNISATNGDISASSTIDSISLGNGNLTALDGEIRLNADDGGISNSIGEVEVFIDAQTVDFHARGIDLNRVTFDAANNLSISTDILSDITSNITAGSASISATDLTISSGAAITTKGGDLSLTSFNNLTIDGTVTTSGGNLIASADTIIINDTIIDNVRVPSDNTYINTAGGDVNLTVNGETIVFGKIDTGGGNFTKGGTGSVGISATIDTAGGNFISDSPASPFSFSQTGLVLTDGGNIEVKATELTSGGAFDTTSSSARPGDVTLEVIRTVLPNMNVKGDLNVTALTNFDSIGGSQITAGFNSLNVGGSATLFTDSALFLVNSVETINVNGALTLNAGIELDLTNNTDLNVGSLNITAGTDIDYSGTSITTGSTNITTTEGSIISDASSSLAVTGNLSIRSDGGAVVMNSPISVTGSTSIDAGGDITDEFGFFNPSGSVTLSSEANIRSTSALDLSGDLTISTADIDENGDANTVELSGAITTTGTVDLTANIIDISNDIDANGITLNANSSITIRDDGSSNTLNTNGGDFRATATAGGITLLSSINTDGGDVVAAGTSITLRSSSDATPTIINSAGGVIDLDSAGVQLIDSGLVSSGGTIDVLSDNNIIIVNGSFIDTTSPDTGAGDVNLTAISGDVILQGSSASVSGDLNINSDRTIAIDLGSTVDVANNATFIAANIAGSTAGEINVGNDITMSVTDGGEITFVNLDTGESSSITAGNNFTIDAPWTDELTSEVALPSEVIVGNTLNINVSEFIAQPATNLSAQNVVITASNVSGNSLTGFSDSLNITAGIINLNSVSSESGDITMETTASNFNVLKIDTSGSVNLTGDGLTINDSLNTGALTLTSSDRISVGNLTTINTNGEDLVATAETDVTLFGRIESTGGLIDITADGDISIEPVNSALGIDTTGTVNLTADNIALDGNINTNGFNLNAQSDITASNAIIGTNGGDFIATSLGDVTFTHINTGGGTATISSGGTLGSGTIVTSGGDISIDTGLLVNNAPDRILSTLSDSASGDINININSAGNSFIPQNIASSGNVTVTASSSNISRRAESSLEVAGDFTLSAASITYFPLSELPFGGVETRLVNVAGDISMTATTGDIEFIATNTSANNISFIAPNGTVSLDTAIDATNNFTINSGTDVTLNGQLSAGNLFDITTAGDIAIEQAIDTTAAINLTAENILISGDINSGGLNLDANVDIVASTVTLNTNSGDFIATALGNIDLLSLDSNGGSITLSSGGDTEIDGSIDGGGADFISTSVGDFFLGGDIFGRGVDAVGTGGNISINTRNYSPTNQSATLNARSDSATGNINITASGNITTHQLYASGDITLNANGNIKLNPVNIEAANDARFTAANIDGSNRAFDTEYNIGNNLVMTVATGGSVTLKKTADLDGLEGVSIIVGNNFTIDAPGTIDTPSIVELPSEVTVGSTLDITAFQVDGLATTLNAPNLVVTTTNLAPGINIAGVTDSLNITADRIDLGSLNVDNADITLNATASNLDIQAIDTTGTVDLTGDNIFISSDLNTGALTLDSRGDITVSDAAFINTNGADFIATAAADFELAGPIDSAGGLIDIDAGGTFEFGVDRGEITSAGGNVIINANEINVPIEGASINTLSDSATGNVTLTARAGDIALPRLDVSGDLFVNTVGSLALSLEGAVIGNDANLSAAGISTLASNEGMDVGNDIAMTVGAGGDVLLGGAEGAPIRAGNNFTINAPAPGSVVDLPSVVTVGNTLDITAFQVDGLATTLSAPNLVVTTTNLAAGINISGVTDSVSITADLIDLGVLSVGDADITLNATASDLDIGGIDTNGIVSLTGDNISINNNLNTGSLTLASREDITVSDAASIDTGGADFIATAGGDFELAGTVDSSGGAIDIRLDTTNGNFNFSEGGNIVSFGGDINIEANNIDGAIEGATFNTLSDTAVGNVTLTSPGNIRLPHLLVSGDLTVDSGGRITLSPEGGQIANNTSFVAGQVLANTSIAGDNTYDFGNDIIMTVASSGSVLLDDAVPMTVGNNFTITAPGTEAAPSTVRLPSVVSVAGNLDIDTYNLSLLPSSLDAQNVSITTSILGFEGDIAGNITDSLNITADEITLDSIDVGTANINIASTSGDLAIGVVNSTSDVDLSSPLGAITFSNINADNLTLSHATGITQSLTGALDISGNTHIQGLGDNAVVELNSIVNDLNTLSVDSQFTEGGSINIEETNGLTVTDINTNHAFTLTSQSGVTLDGRVSSPSADQQALIQINAQDLLNVTANASFENIDPASSINLGGADDIINISASMPIDIFSGAGEDTFNILVDNISLGTLDGGEDDDTLNVGALAVETNFFGDTKAGEIDVEDKSIESINSTTSGSSNSVLHGVDGFDAIWTINADGSVIVTVTKDGEAVTVDGEALEPILFPDIDTLLGADGNDRFVYADDTNAIRFIDGADGDDSLSLAGSNGNLIWDLADADSGRNIIQSITEFVGIEAVEGSAGDDTFNIDTADSINTIDGGFGNNTLVSQNVSIDNVWFINDVDQGTLNGGLSFVNVGNLTGNDNSDSFTLNDTANISGVILGAGGDDRLELISGLDFTWVLNKDNNDAIQDVANFNEIESIFGSSGNDTITITGASDVTSIDSREGNNSLSAMDQLNTWTINGINTGTLNNLSFNNIGNLIGGSDIDTFTLTESGVVDSFDGGAGQDSLESTRTTGETLWNVNPDNDNSIAFDTDTITFTNVEQLIGGASDDKFDITQGQVDTISGGDGANSLRATFAGTDQVWQLNTDDGSIESGAFNVAFDGVQSVEGYDESDPALDVTFFLNDLNSIITSISSTVLTTSTVSFANVADAFTLDLKDNSSRTFGSIDAFQGNGAASIVIGLDQDSEWSHSADGVRYTVLDESISDINFLDFGTISGGTANDTFIATEGINDWAITGTNSGTFNSNQAFTGMEALVGSNNTDTFTFNENTRLTSIDALGGDDTVILASGVAIETIIGGEGNDTLNSGSQSVVRDYLGKETTGTTIFSGDDFEDRITGPDGQGGITFFGGDGNNEWLITGENTGTLTKLDGPNAGTSYAITGGVVSLLGGSGVDAFVISDGGSIRDGLSAGGNTNSLTVNSTGDTTWLIDGEDQGLVTVASTATLFQNIANLIGSDSNDTFEIVAGGSLTGSIDGGAGSDLLLMSDPSPTNLWTLDTVNSVNGINSFSAIEAITGNGNADVFNITANTDVINIDDGAGADSINWTGSDLTVDLINATLNGSISFVSVSDFTADLDQDNTFIGSNDNSSWVLSDHGIGTLSATETISFNHFNTLMGGTGEDTLTGLDQVTTWSIDGLGQGSLNTDTGQSQFSGMDALIAGAENDTFELNSLDAEIVNGIIAGEGSNNLVGLADQQYTWTVSSDYAGTVNGGMTFAQIQNIQGGEQGDTFVIAADSTIGDLTGGSEADEFTIGLNATVGTIRSGAGDDTIDVNNLATIINVEGGLGTDTLDLVKLEGAVTVDFLGRPDNGISSIEVENIIVNPEDVTFFGGDGNNEWVFDGVGSGTLTKLDGPDAGTYTFTDKVNFLSGDGDDTFVLTADGDIPGYLNGGAGNNSLTGKDLINQWLIDGQEQGSLASSDDTGAIFRNISHIIGSDIAADTFTITAGGYVAQIDAGSPVLNVNQSDTGLGDIISDRLILDQDVTASWLIGDTNQVLIGAETTQFSGIKIIDASLGDDTFTITATSQELTSINGRSGADVLDISGLNQASIVDLQQQTAAGLSIESIESYLANSALNNQIIGLDSEATWTMNDGFSGTVSYSEGSETVNFGGFSLIQGGSANDHFDYTSLSAGTPLATSTDGGLGDDSISTNNDDNSWLLSANGGDLNGVTFTSIETLAGGSGQDNFVLTSSATSATLLEGGTGENSLTGFDQDNTWVINTDNSGQINDINFSDIQSVSGGSNVDVFTVAAGTSLKDIAGGDGNDIITIGANSSVNNVYGNGGDDTIVINDGLTVTGVIDGGTTGETNGDYLDISGYTVDNAAFDITTLLGFTTRNFADISSPSISDTLHAGNGTNWWFITGPDQGRLETGEGEDRVTTVFTDVKTIIGGSGDDFIVFEEGGSISELIDGGEGDGSDTLDFSGQNLVNQWILDGANSGTVSNDANPEGNIFINIATIIGGSALDTVFNNSAEHATWVLAGVHQGTINIDTSTIAFQGMDRIVGGELNNDQLVGAGDQAYNWTIDNLMSGSLETAVNNGNQFVFENIATIVGGDNNDNFYVTTRTDIAIDGGAAISGDYIDFSQVNANLSIKLNDSLTGETGVIAGFESIRGNNSGADSINNAELIGSNSDNVWTISDFDGSGAVDGVNDGTYTSGTSVVSFTDFNILSGGANSDTFNQSTGVIEGALYGNGGNDSFNVILADTPAGALDNRGTLFIGGEDNDTLSITGGQELQRAIYTPKASGGEFEYVQGNRSYRISHDSVEMVNESTLASTLELRGSEEIDHLALANGAFSFNQAPRVAHRNKVNLVTHVDANDTVELIDNLNIEGSLTLTNGVFLTKDSDNTSISARRLVLDTTQGFGTVDNVIHTSIDELEVTNAIGAIHIQEEYDLVISEFAADANTNITLVNGNLTNSSPLAGAGDIEFIANNGNITLIGQNDLTGQTSFTASSVEFTNASSINAGTINADYLKLISGRDILQTEAITVTGDTILEAGNQIVLDHSQNDFNNLSITAAQDATTVDKNELVLTGVNVNGHLNIASDGLNVDQNVSAVSINFDGGTGAFVQNEQATVEATTDVTVTAEKDVTVGEISTTTTVSLESVSGEIIDGNGEQDNIIADLLEATASEGFGNTGGIEINVTTINIDTIEGNLTIVNTGTEDLGVANATTESGNVSIVSEGNIDLMPGSIKAGSDGDLGGSVTVDTVQGSVKQIGSTAEPAIVADKVEIIAEQGDVGAGGLVVNATKITVIAQRQAGDLITPPGTTRDVQFSGTFTFEDQLLVVEQFEDVSPAVFSNVKGYFFNDVSLKLSADQLYDDEAEDEEDGGEYDYDEDFEEQDSYENDEEYGYNGGY